MAGEWWDGWFDFWGGPHHTTDAKAEANELGWILSQGYSISIYMFHGGTNFGWMNGANMDKTPYRPDVTSYDYDAALDESGRPSPKYFLFRDAIAKATGITPPEIPAVESCRSLRPPSLPKQSASLWHTLPQPVKSEQPMTMEDLDQAYGYILYRTTIASSVSGDLVLDELHDYALVYANGKLLGSLDRRLEQNRMEVDLKEPNTRLDILVENTGRVNFTALDPRRAQGNSTKQVTLAGKPADRLADLSSPHERSRQTGLQQRRLHGRLFLSGHLAGGSSGRYVPRHQQLCSKGFVCR